MRHTTQGREWWCAWLEQLSSLTSRVRYVLSQWNLVNKDRQPLHMLLPRHRWIHGVVGKQCGRDKGNSIAGSSALSVQEVPLSTVPRTPWSHMTLGHPAYTSLLQTLQHHLDLNNRGSKPTQDIIHLSYVWHQHTLSDLEVRRWLRDRETETI